MRRLRVDGRSNSETRFLQFELGLLSSTDGSARLRCGRTSVLASVLGPRPTRSMRLEEPTRALLEVHIAPVSGTSVPVKDAELAAALRAAIAPLILLRASPRSIITLSILVETDDGGVSPAAFNAALLALADADVPMRSLAAACGVCILASGGGGGGGSGAAAAAAAATTTTTFTDPSGDETARGAARVALWAAFAADADIDTIDPLAIISVGGPTTIEDLELLLTTAAEASRETLVLMRRALMQHVMRDAVNCAPEVRAALGVGGGG